MVEINVYTPIGSQSQVMIGGKSFTEAVFSADSVRRLFDTHKDEEEFKFNIHCDGGDVAEGFTMYDLIRGSGKTIHTQIDGGCHSMAVILLLSAPKENRTANKNARALIHFVYAQADGMMNAEQAGELKDYILKEQNSIIDIYEDRTDLDRQSLEDLMSEERELTAQELLDYGFITRINPYTTNKKPTNTNFNKMAQKPKQGFNARLNSVRLKTSNFLDHGTFNYLHTDIDDGKGFETDIEDDHLEVGMRVDGEDGTYRLESRTVVIEGGEIRSIDEHPRERPEDIEMVNQIAEYDALLEEALAENVRLRNQIGGKQVIKGRIGSPRNAKSSQNMSSTERKAAMLSRREELKGGR